MSRDTEFSRFVSGTRIDRVRNTSHGASNISIDSEVETGVSQVFNGSQDFFV